MLSYLDGNECSIDLKIDGEEYALLVQNDDSAVIELVSDYVGKPIPRYHGEYHVTPTSEMQELPTAGTELVENIVIDPVPNNYGLITWNGSTLTVS